jgi:DNA-binding protein Fis
VIGGPHAAARLGLKRSTLRDRMEKLRLLRPPP